MRVRAFSHAAPVAVASEFVSAAADGQVPFSGRTPFIEAIAKNETSVPNNARFGTGFIAEERGDLSTPL